MNTSTSTSDPVGTPAVIAATPTPTKMTRDTGGKAATNFSSANLLVRMKGGFITPTQNRHKDKDAGKDIEDSSTIDILDDGTENGTVDNEDDDSVVIVEREDVMEEIAEMDECKPKSTEDDTSTEDSSYAEEIENNDNGKRNLRIRRTLRRQNRRILLQQQNA